MLSIRTKISRPLVPLEELRLTWLDELRGIAV